MSTPSKRPRARGPASSRQGPNLLLATLSPSAFAELSPHLVSVSFAVGDVLSEPLEPLADVCFPDSAVLSLIVRMDDGTPIEVGTVGHEGFAGLPALFGTGASDAQCIAQVPGLARMLPVERLRPLIADGRPLRDVLLRYAHAFLHQTAYRSACSALHTVRQRCARWLLTTDDTAGANGAGERGFLLTQEYLAYMLGVRREGVSAAARAFRDEGLLRFSRGYIIVTDRAGLEAASCECYRVVAQEYGRVLGPGAR